MSVHKMRRKAGVGYQVRWRDESGAPRAKTFDRRQDAVQFEGETRRLKQLGQLAQLDAGKGTLAEFGETWWGLYARPHLAIATKELYAGIWDRHILPELGDH